MTDLKNFIHMLCNSNETFSKEKSGDDWVVKITGRGFRFYFSKDEKFQYCCQCTHS